ncbi:DUF3592 domain-containing protein [Occallatibacter riparius]|uniref:DUF3592 domain-containing protein n=2 Tax=Occallatibacter riparius TaxID=1002689 RepID=A0A9J7BWB3_9BACT|nr:DUF3592 domain-containing protein [Occallatibacter riparius]
MAGGVGVAVIGVGFAIHTTLFLRSALSATGTVAELQSLKDDQSGGIVYSPIFRFAAADGQTYTITSSTGSNPPSFVVGQTVRVLYEREHPSDALIDSFGQLWLFPLIFCPLGIAFAAAGYLVLRFDRRLTVQMAATAL